MLYSFSFGCKIFVLLLIQVERFVDRKLDKVETILKKKQRKAKGWYNKYLGEEDDFTFQEIHVFLASFVAGLAIGMASGRIL
jgi:FUN14 domain-containing protein 1